MRGRADKIKLSVVVPVAPGEKAWKALLQDLGTLGSDCEILLAGLETRERSPGARWIECPFQGRAKQMNFAASEALGNYLWFLHADSRLSPEALRAAKQSVKANLRALHFFDLRFEKDKSPWMLINEWGTRFRSRIFSMPFGDQGFLLPRKLFFDLGAFDEEVALGEDHLFVWKARHHDIPLVAINESIVTSARKYEERGWLKTTSKHLFWTYRQAFPQFLSQQKKRLKKVWMGGAR